MSIDIPLSPYCSWRTTVSIELVEVPLMFETFPDLAGFRPMLPDTVQTTYRWSRDLLSDGTLVVSALSRIVFSNLSWAQL